MIIVKNTIIITVLLLQFIVLLKFSLMYMMFITIHGKPI